MVDLPVGDDVVVKGFRGLFFAAVVEEEVVRAVVFLFAVDTAVELFLFVVMIELKNPSISEENSFEMCSLLLEEEDTENGEMFSCSIKSASTVQKISSFEVSNASIKSFNASSEGAS